MNGLCAVDGCAAPAATRGWCHRHYLRWCRTGDPHVTRKRGPKPRAGTVPDLTAVRRRALELRDRDPAAARQLVDSALQKRAAPLAESEAS